jgi:hypothetical protein
MDIQENDLFDYVTNIKKIHEKFIKSEIADAQHILSLYDAVAKILKPHGVKLYVSTMNLINIIAQFELDAGDDDNVNEYSHKCNKLIGSCIYYTNTTITIKIYKFANDVFLVILQNFEDHFFGHLEFYPDGHISISFESSTGHYVTIDDNNMYKKDSPRFDRSKNYFFNRAQKYIDPQIYIDYLQLCTKEQQLHTLTQINVALPNKKRCLN